MRTGRHLAIIPARGGSIGLKDKNLRRIRGKSLIGRAVKVALAAPEIRDVLVSTDSQEIADEARRNGAQVPFARPAELSKSETPMTAVLSHAFDWYRASRHIPDGLAIVLLQPTSPMRKLEHVRAAIAAYEERKRRGAAISAIQTVSPLPETYSPERLYRVSENGTLRSAGLNAKASLVYRNGAAIVIDPDDIRALTLRRGTTCGLFVTERLISIDNWLDLALARAALDVEGS